MNLKINFQNDFAVCMVLFEIAKTLYFQKDYEECLSFINESMEMMDLTNLWLFSDFLLLTGNILWKKYHYQEAVNLWEKAAIYKPEDRAIQLRLAILNKNNKTEDIYSQTKDYRLDDSCAYIKQDVDEVVIKLKTEYL